MQQANTNAVVTLIRVGPLIPTGTSRTKATLHRVEATGTAIVDRERTPSGWEMVEREIDFTFVELVEGHARRLVEGAQISVMGATPISYNVPIGFPTDMAGWVAQADREYSPKDGAVSPEAVVNGVVAMVEQGFQGAEGYDTDALRTFLLKAIPGTKRKTIVKVGPGDWSALASPQAMAAAAVQEGAGFELEGA